MKLAMQYRVITAAQWVDLSVKCAGGATETIRLPPYAAKGVGEALIKASKATKTLNVEWAPTRHQIPPGLDGSFQAGVSAEGPCVLLCRTPLGVELEFLPPPEDAASMIHQLQTVLQMATDKHQH